MGKWVQWGYGGVFQEYQGIYGDLYSTRIWMMKWLGISKIVQRIGGLQQRLNGLIEDFIIYRDKIRRIQ